MTEINIRDAVATDVPMLFRMMRELAEHDELMDFFKATEDSLRRDGFGDPRRFRALIAEADGETAGYVRFDEGYSPFTRRGFLEVDDVYVRERYRRRGIGKAMMLRLRDLALAQGFTLRWEMELENHRARAFYEGLGATTRPKRICYWKVAG